jgi:hypothetical protein
MLVDKRSDITVQGNLDGQKVAMKFDENSLAHIMSVLTDLYSDPELAVIREYSTNALDSHKEAGVTRPIEVTLPSPLSPFFKIKDYGVGLSVEEVVNVYSKYGASTKRDSNDFNGMLGLGGKSALTYTSQFNVVAIKGGVKIHVSVSRAEDGTGTMEIVDTVSTTEPNGVEIVIPVGYGSRFDEKAKNFYSFWDKGTVLLNGKEPDHIDGNKVAEGIYSVHGLDEDYVVMGGVAYPVDGGLWRKNSYKDFGIVAYVAIGDVHFTPSREALQYTPKTKATVERVRDEFEAGLLESIKADIAASADHAEAIARTHSWRKMLGYHMPANMDYKGAVVPDRWNVAALTFEPNGYRRQQVFNTRTVQYDWVKDAVVILNYPHDGIPTNNKKKIVQWADENELSDDKFLLIPGSSFGDNWLSNVETVDWADIKAIKLDNGPRKQGGVRGKQSYMRYDSSKRYFVPDDTLSTSADIFYFSPKEYYRDSGAVEALTTVKPDAMIVMLGMNRWDKFLRSFPKAKHIRTSVDELIATAAVGVSDDDKAILSLNADYSARNVLKRLDETKIDDPDLAAAVSFAKGGKLSDEYAHYCAVKQAARFFGKHVPDLSVPTFKNPLSKYPLVSNNTYGNVHPHTYLYINAAFAAGN